MFLVLAEIAMFLFGVYAILTTKVPAAFLGGGKYQIEGRAARLCGILFILPPLVALALGMDSVPSLIAFFACLILAVVVARTAGKQVQFATSAEAAIEKKSNGAYMYAILSCTGLAALIACPLAINYANQALELISENGVGQQYRRKAEQARAMAKAATVVWLLVVVVIIVVVMLGLSR